MQAPAENTSWCENASSSLIPSPLYNPVPLPAGGGRCYGPRERNRNRGLDVTLQEVEDAVPPNPGQETAGNLTRGLDRDTGHSGRKKSEKQQRDGKAALCRSPVGVLTYLHVSHGVVPPEDPGGGDVSHQHVDAVVLVSDEDAEDARGAEEPAEPVVPPHPARRVWTQEKSQRKVCPDGNCTP